MKRYKASYTIEATVTVTIATMVVVYMIMLSLYVTDAIVAKNIEIIEAIDCEDNYYYYSLQNTKEINIDRKLSDCFTKSEDLSTGRCDARFKKYLVASDVTSISFSRGAGGITVMGNLDYRPETKLLRNMSVKETVSNRNEAEFIRGVNSLCKEVFKN